MPESGPCLGGQNVFVVIMSNLACPNIGSGFQTVFNNILILYVICIVKNDKRYCKSDSYDSQQNKPECD